ncbi:MAG TPA: hypothetical protein DEB48_07740 [Verrucomicrobiales bacterium]|nr:hypothetical protein [Verrucomicrobiales bacterium]
MEIKKGEPQDSELGDPVDIKNPKTLKSTAGLWPEWLPYGHAAFLLILLLALLLGYGLPYEKPEQPQRDYRANYESVEEEKKAVKEYDQKVEAYEKEKKAWDEGGEESRRGWIAVGRNLAKFSTVLWLIFSFIVYGLMPLLRMIPRHFGKDLSITLLPVLMLGVLYSLSRLVVEWIPDSGWPLPSPLELNDQSLWKVMGQFIVHLTHPIADMVITLKEFAVDKWFVPLLFVAATLVIGWRQSIPGKVDESSRKKP